MILIYPPVAKISEPPPGVAILAGALKAHNIDCKVVDANMEGMLWLAKSSHKVRSLSAGHSSNTRVFHDSWSRRAVTHLDRNISDLKDISVYRNMARYRQRVMDLNKVISISPDGRFKITLSDYSDVNLTPVKSGDLLTSARQYSENPFYLFFETHLLRQIEENSSDYIGISLCYLSQALTSFALSGWIKARFPEKKIVMGGGLVTSWMSMPTWSEPFKTLVDCMVRGRGEETLINLFREREKFIIKKDIKARVYKPDFDFCKWDQYIAPGRILPFRTATGCYWNRCRFCPEKAEGNRYRGGGNSKLLEDIHYLVNRYHPDYIHFIDDAIPPSFLKALVAQNSVLNYDGATSLNRDNIGLNSITLREPPFKWYGFVRFTKELADPEFCKALYRSGCRMLKLGLESGDQAVLDKMEKGTNLDLASRILTTLRNADIHTYVYLLFGTQFEDEAEAHKTLDYIISHSDRISYLNLAIFNLPRFSEDASILETNLFSQGDLSLYLGFKHPKGWDRKKVRFFLDRKFRKHPAIAAILEHDPPFFTSNHAMFVV